MFHLALEHAQADPARTVHVGDLYHVDVIGARRAGLRDGVLFDLADLYSGVDCPRVGSFDGGLGSSYLARIVGQKKAREIWYLCRQYDAHQALEMGLVNTVVPLADLETETVQWCREILQHSPLALRCLKSALNADCDGQMGLLDLAGNATLLYYMSEEAKEGKQAFIEKRKPDFGKFPRVP